MATLSIIVPGRNVAPFAENLRASARANDHSGIDWVFIDDASTDSTGASFAALAADLGDAQVIQHDRQEGLAKSRNDGILAARGEFVTFLDADDWVAPAHYERVLDDVERFDVDLIRYGYTEVYPDRRTVQLQATPLVDCPIDPRDHIMPVHKSTLVDYPQAWATAARRSFLLDGGMFDPTLFTAEDREWMWRLMLKTDRMVVSSALGNFWRRAVPGSLTQTGGHEQLDFIRVYETLFGWLGAAEDLRRYLPKARRAYLGILFSQLQQSGRLAPADRRTLAHAAKSFVASLTPEELTITTFRLGATRRVLLAMIRAKRSDAALARAAQRI